MSRKSDFSQGTVAKSRKRPPPDFAKLLPSDAGHLIVFGEAEWFPGQVGYEDMNEWEGVWEGDNEGDALALARWLQRKRRDGYVALAASGLFLIAWNRKEKCYRIRRTILRSDVTKVDLYTYGLSVKVTVATHGTVDSFCFVKGNLVDRAQTVKAFSALRKMLIAAKGGGT